MEKPNFTSEIANCVKDAGPIIEKGKCKSYVEKVGNAAKTVNLIYLSQDDRQRVKTYFCNNLRCLFRAYPKK